MQRTGCGWRGCRQKPDLPTLGIPVAYWLLWCGGFYCQFHMGDGPHTLLPMEDALHPWAPPAPAPGLLLHLLMPTASQSWVLPGATGQQPHLVDHHSSLEDGQEVRWLLAHRDPDLDRFIVVLLVQDDGLISRCCYFILAGLATLGTSTMEVGEMQSALVLSPSLAAATTPSLILTWP